MILYIYVYMIALFSCFDNQEKIITILIEKDYLNIPVQLSQERDSMVFILKNRRIREFEIRLSNEKPDYWIFTDVSDFKGESITITYPKNVSGLNQIYQSNEIAGADSLYKETYRPQFHFTTRRGWNNDPNGMVYYDGEYHLFYQHNPYETNWGNMHWGHAVSKDLVHWRELPIALFPDELGTMFSGSAVIDYNNTSGFGRGDEYPMVAIYTADYKDSRQQQCIAYSFDKGRTFHKYEGNPVIPSLRRFGSGHERDPKVFWYEPGKHWVMVLHDAINYTIYNSDNLREWEFKSYVDAGFWECPELFELTIDGNEGNRKWVMYGVNGTYLLGDFDGKSFTPETEMLRYNIGGMTAAQTFNDEPNGRRLQIGWGHARFPDMPFSQTFTFVQEFSLKTTRNGVRLFVEPVKEIENLYTKSHKFEDEYIGEDINNKLAEIKSAHLHIKAKFEIDNARSFGVDINGYRINYTVNNNMLNNAFLPLDNRQLELEVLVDKTLIEVYGNGGLIYWFANHNQRDLDSFRISLFQWESGLNPDPKTLVKSLEINELKSIWH